MALRIKFGWIVSEVLEGLDVCWIFDTLISVKGKPIGTGPKFTARLLVVSPAPGSEFIERAIASRCVQQVGRNYTTAESEPGTGKLVSNRAED